MQQSELKEEVSAVVLPPIEPLSAVFPQKQREPLAPMILALICPLVLSLARLETASFLRLDRTFQHLAGLPNFPNPQTSRPFLMEAPAALQLQCQHPNNHHCSN